MFFFIALFFLFRIFDENASVSICLRRSHFFNAAIDLRSEHQIESHFSIFLVGDARVYWQ